MNSLKFRLLVSSFFVFMLFMGAAGLVLDRAFVAKANSLVQNRLVNEIYELLRSANVGANGALNFPKELKDDHFMQPKSGYYAAVAHKNKITWNSASNFGIKIPYNKDLAPGNRTFSRVKADDGSEVFLLSLGYVWADQKAAPILYTFNVAESCKNYELELVKFRHGLWTWMLIILCFLFVFQTATLIWGLRPLGKMRKDLTAIEEGKREYLDINYIDEIKDLTMDLNTLLRFERSLQERYKNALGDLAHSFKTPLAVINTVINNDEIDKKVKKVLSEQVNNLSDLVTYQLRRAQSAASIAGLSKPINVLEHVNKVMSALSKVYQAKNIVLIKNIDKDALFYGNVGDLLEVFGNLLDNAHKWCKNKIKVTVIKTEMVDGVNLTLIVEDDGPGITDDKKHDILRRGVRADEKTPGHGIGMSILTNIVSAYSGSVEVEDSEMGGAKFIIQIKH